MDPRQVNIRSVQIFMELSLSVKENAEGEKRKRRGEEEEEEGSTGKSSREVRRGRGGASTERRRSGLLRDEDTLPDVIAALVRFPHDIIKEAQIQEEARPHLTQISLGHFA